MIDNSVRCSTDLMARTRIADSHEEANGGVGKPSGAAFKKRLKVEHDQDLSSASCHRKFDLDDDSDFEMIVHQRDPLADSEMCGKPSKGSRCVKLEDMESMTTATNTPMDPSSLSPRTVSPTSEPAWAGEVGAIDFGAVGTEGAAAAIQSVLKSAVVSDPLLQVPKPADNSREHLELPPSALALASVVETGHFPTRNSSVSRRWDKEIKNMSETAKRYAEIPKNYALQRNFKLAWAKKELEEEVKKYTESTTTSNSTVSRGEYLSFNCVMQAEGGGRLGFEAAKNYLFSARRFAAAGKMLRGRPLLVYNSWTRFVEMLYVKNGFEDAITDARAITSTWAAPTPPTLPAPPGEASSTQLPAALTEPPVGEPSSTKLPAASTKPAAKVPKPSAKKGKTGKKVPGATPQQQQGADDKSLRAALALAMKKDQSSRR